jgi:hypothetical protein
VKTDTLRAVQVAGLDPLRDEAIVYAEALRAAGVQVELYTGQVAGVGLAGGSLRRPSAFEMGGTEEIIVVVEVGVVLFRRYFGAIEDLVLTLWWDANMSFTLKYQLSEEDALTYYFSGQVVD